MGKRAVQVLNASGIKVYRVDGETVDEVIREFNQGFLEEITPEDSCSQHRCH
ncbi:MAG: hypothetical protein NC818_00020 [Candidatus Omnitrophica bacterium]|nr:hypothetical protein [Candidatus Omnitrophota bacterium]